MITAAQTEAQDALMRWTARPGTRQERDLLIISAVCAGLSRRHVGRLLGLSHTRVSQIMDVHGVGEAGRRLLPTSAQSAAVRRYKRGESSVVIAADLGVDPQTVRGWVMAAGGRMRDGTGRPRRWDAVPAGEIVARYQAGESPATIARLTGRSRRLVVDVLRSAGVPLRTHREAVAMRAACPGKQVT